MRAAVSSQPIDRMHDLGCRPILCRQPARSDYRALAGMWPWGAGRLRLPPRETMTFMPQRPYLPLGTLRVAVCYPAEPGHFDEATVVAALERVDLDHLVPSLDRTDRWDRQLPLDEQQRLAFARLLLHAPRWVVADDALSALRDSHRRRMLSLCDRELVGADPPRPRSRPGRLLEPNPAHHRASGRTLPARRPAASSRRVGALPTSSTQSSVAGSRVNDSKADDRRSATSRNGRQER
jgi:putative ATP-binding cassette transporter